MVHKLLGVFNVVRGLTHQGSEDVGQLLGDTVGDCSPIGYNEHKGLLVLWILGSP